MKSKERPKKKTVSVIKETYFTLSMRGRRLQKDSTRIYKFVEDSSKSCKKCALSVANQGDDRNLSFVTTICDEYACTPICRSDKKCGYFKEIIKDE